MYPKMCVKIALCLALVICIQGHVIKQVEVPLSPDGMIVEIKVKDKADEQHPVSAMKIDINEKDKKVVVTMEQSQIRVPKQAVNGSPTEVLPTIEDRNNIRVGTCPTGYTRRGGFCFPDDDY